MRTGAVCESKATWPTGGSRSTVSELSEGRTCTLAVSGPTSTVVGGTSSRPTIPPSTATTAVVVMCSRRALRRRSRRRRTGVLSADDSVGSPPGDPASVDSGTLDSGSVDSRSVDSRSADSGSVGTGSRPGSTGSCGGSASVELTGGSTEEADAARLLGGDLGVGDLLARDQHGAALVVHERDGGAVGDRAAEPLEEGVGLLLGLDDDLAGGVLDADTDLHDLTFPPPPGRGRSLLCSRGVYASAGGSAASSAPSTTPAIRGWSSGAKPVRPCTTAVVMVARIDSRSASSLAPCSSCAVVCVIAMTPRPSTRDSSAPIRREAVSTAASSTAMRSSTRTTRSWTSSEITS